MHSPFSRWLSSIATIGGNAVLQAITLIIFAHWLGPVEYATIVIATAAAMVAAEFVGIGAGDLLIREVSRNPDAQRLYFGRALWLMGLTIVPFSLIAAFCASRFLSAAPMLVLWTLVSSEIVAIRIVVLAEQIAIAHHKIHVANLNRIFAVFVRFGAVCTAVFLAGVTTASGWAVFAAASAAVVAIGCLLISARQFGAPDFKHGPALRSEVGISFSLMQIIRAIQFSLDKFIVASVASPTTVGAFGVASRVSQLGLAPASAITRMTYPLFFKRGARGLDAAVRFAFRITPPVMGVALLSSAALAGIAYVLPPLLGPEFAESKNYLLLLALLPLASALQNLAGSVLSGADLQLQRVFSSAVGLLLTAGATLVGATAAGVIGATIGYLAGHFLTAAAMILAVTVFRRRSPSQS